MFQSFRQKGAKNNAAPQYSHVVPDHTTDWAVRWLTLQIGRDAVFSASYGRIRHSTVLATNAYPIIAYSMCRRKFYESVMQK
jgi:hypothetical protein